MENNNKKRKVYQMEIDETDEQSGVFALSMVSDPAIMEGWVALSKQHKIELKVTDEAKRIVTGPVLFPDQKIMRLDENGEEYDIVFTKEVIQKAAELFLKRQNNLAITLEHEKSIEGSAYIMESWISVDSKADKSYALLNKEYPVGSWFVSAKITNNELYQQFIKEGKLSGWSLEGLFSHKRINASATTSEGSNTGSEGSEEESSSEEISKEEKLIEALKSILFEYLETSTSITSTNAGTFGTGSIVTDAQ
jgi:hypothetical protein